MSRWPNIALGEVLTQRKEYIDAPEAREYPKLSVRLYGKGVVLDTPVDGSSLKMKRHQLAKPGQVILSEIWGKKGAIGFVPPEGEGALCTSHFFLFDVDETRLLPGWLQALFAADHLAPQLEERAFGTTGYASVRPRDLLSAEIPLPPIEEQRRVVEKLNRLADLAHRGERQMASTGLSMRALVPARLNELASTWSRRGTLADVLTGKPKNGWSARCDGDPAGVAVLALGAVTGFDYRSHEHKRTSLPTDPGANYWLRPGDLLMTRSNTPELVGHAAIYDGTPAPCIYPDLVMRLPVDISKALPRFVWYWLQSPIARKHVRTASKGTSPTMAKIGQGTVMAMPFPAGIALEAQERFVAELDRLTGVSGRAANVARRRNEEMAGLLSATLAELMGPA